MPLQGEKQHNKKVKSMACWATISAKEKNRAEKGDRKCGGGRDGGRDDILDRVARKSSEGRVKTQGLKGEKERVMQISGERAFLVEGLAGAKVLR